MAKVKIGKWEVDAEELEREFAKATKRGEKATAQEPQAKSVRYDKSSHRIIVELKSGAIFILPCERVQGLSNADPKDIAKVELGPRGAALFWDKLGVDFSLQGLMAGIFGNKAWMAELERSRQKRKSGRKTVVDQVNESQSGRPRPEQGRKAR